MIHRSVLILAALGMFFGNFSSGTLPAGELYVGGATISITPEERVALDGQMYTRISEKVEAPCMATALAIETRNGEQSLDQAIFVSCDLVFFGGGKSTFFGDEQGFCQEFRQAMNGHLPAPLISKIILNATHTHTGPVTEEGLYWIPESGVMQPTEYREFLIRKLVDVVMQAWEKRAPAQVSWGLGHAVVAQNRRVFYANGKAALYGKTNNPDFRGIEGYEDHGIELLYFWDAGNKLIATAINVSCPSQVVESRSAVNADYWHEVREQLRAKHGKELLVLAWCGAAGDQSPRPMYRQGAEARMRKLRGVSELSEVARRITDTWEDVYQVVQNDRHANVEFQHYIKVIELPRLKLTSLQANASQAASANVTDPKFQWKKFWLEGVAKRYEKQQAGELLTYQMELHAVRLGDVAIVTNEFELYTDYGVQMKARSPALQTFVIQLCGGGTYLPNERAVQGGGYSAIPESNLVGPEGGQVLVEESVRAIQLLWPAEEKKK